MTRGFSHIIAVLANIVLALVLVFGYVPFVAFATIPHAWADDAQSSESAEGQDPNQGNSQGSQGAQDDDEAERQRQEEEAQKAAEEAQKKLAEDQAAADAVIALIDALPAATSAVGADKPTADAALQAYNELTADQQALVPAEKVGKLNAVVAAAAAAKEQEEQQSQEPSSSGSSEPSGSSESPGGEPSPSDEPGPSDEPVPPEPETYYVKKLLLRWDKPDADGVTHFVGDANIVERAYKTISITEFGETVQLNGYYLSTDDTGEAYQTVDSSTSIGSFDLNWASSDESIAVVSPAGLVRPQGKNGTVVITASVADPRVYQGDVPTATVSITFDGQDGKYVKCVEILDDGGNAIGEQWGGVTVYEKENEFHQLHARITWHNVIDGTETTEVTGSGDTYDASGIGTTITWGISASTAFSINEDTGRLRCGAYSGNAFVTCTAVGGLGGKVVTDTANVQLDTGVYEYNPSDSLTLKVVWEERPDEVVKEATYTYEELLGMLPTRKVNATVVSSQRFGVISAEGFLFKDIVNLVAVDDADVFQYRFSTADGYDNPVSYKYLFDSGNRYYFPNYELGKSRAEGEIVPPVLAYKSTLQWNTSEANPEVALDEGTRFRLVFGCLATGDANTSFQIYYIHGITVVLKGAPSAGGNNGNGDKTKPGDDAKPEKSKPSQKDPDKQPEKSGQSQDSEDPVDVDAPEEQQEDPTEAQDGGWQDIPGSGNGSNSGNSSNGGQGSRNANGAQSGSPNGTATTSSQTPQAASDASEAQASPGGETPRNVLSAAEAAAGTDVGSSKRWRVYQMMNKTNSDVPDWDDENPISPFALPMTVGTFVAGVGATGIGFIRRLR